MVKGTDLIAATHGRSFWILDDLTPLHQLTDEVRQQDAHLFKPATAQRFKTYGRYGENAGAYMTYGRVGGMLMTHYTRKGKTGENEYEFLDAGKNPPSGAVIYYYLKNKPEGEVKLTFLDNNGNEVNSFSSETNDGVHPTVDAGLNRFVWNMRHSSANAVPGSPLSGDALAGPVVVPGKYQVKLTVGDESYTQPLEIARDPRVAGSQSDLQAQFDLLLKVRDVLSETHDTVNRLRDLKEQVQGWSKRVDDDDVKKSADAIVEKLTAVELELIQPKAGSPLQPPSAVNDKLSALAGMIANADVRPTEQSQAVFDKLAAQVDGSIEKVDPIVGLDIAAFNRMLVERGIQPVKA